MAINTYFNYVYTSVFYPILLHVMHLSMLGCYGGRGRAQAQDLNSDQFFCSNTRPQGSNPGSKKCKFLTPRALLLVKRVQIPQPHLPPKNAKVRKNSRNRDRNYTFHFLKDNRAMTSKCNICCNGRLSCSSIYAQFM